MGCLLHVWNHSLFKSLLFYAAGSVIHAVHTREIDLMGGLVKVMPRTALLFLIGAIAICGLPPLNGFVSELFVYLGLFRSLTSVPGAALAAPALALVGALALACFVKAFGAVFLGHPRSLNLTRGHEAAWPMVLPMAILAGCCAAIGVLPVLALRPLESVIQRWNPSVAQGPALDVLAPLASIMPITLTVFAILLTAFLLGKTRFATIAARSALTWDCGYAAPFPVPAEFHSGVDDVVVDGFLIPMWRRFRSRLGWLRVLQQGNVQAYILYILLILSVLLLLTMPLGELVRSILGGIPH